MQPDGWSVPQNGCASRYRATGRYVEAAICIASSSGLMLAIG